jgi:coenzyme F420-reducing hydrogenase beta subunit
MSLNAEGFYAPQVDKSKCIHCGKCVEYCPMCNIRIPPTDCWSVPKIYAGWSRDNAIRCKSSSGGIFSELARAALTTGGSVVGCVWGDNWVPAHRLTTSFDGVVAMQGSKYVPSYVGTVYHDTVKFIKQTGKPVLFSGTPCQIAAMRRIAGKDLCQNII